MESAASLDRQRAGAGSGLGHVEDSAKRLPLRPAFAPRREGFGRILIDQRWAQPMRAFATASRQERDRGWLAIMAQGGGLALQAARHRWGGVVSYGGKA